MFSKIRSLEKNLEKKGILIKDNKDIIKIKVDKLLLKVFIFEIDWYLLDSWINNLDNKNNKLLKKAWKIKKIIL